jgi:acetyl-CoA C-acetyltransferase
MMRGGYGRLGSGVLRTLTGQRERNNGAWRRLISVYVGGQGMVPITRNQGASLKEMGATAINAAIQDAGVDPKNVGALYVGNMMSGMLSDQQHMGPYLATAAGLAGIEATTIEACCGCGGAAIRMGYMAVASGMHETVIVAGVEQMTHQDRDMVRATPTGLAWRCGAGDVTAPRIACCR